MGVDWCGTNIKGLSTIQIPLMNWDLDDTKALAALRRRLQLGLICEIHLATKGDCMTRNSSFSSGPVGLLTDANTNPLSQEFKNILHQQFRECSTLKSNLISADWLTLLCPHCDHPWNNHPWQHCTFWWLRACRSIKKGSSYSRIPSIDINLNNYSDIIGKSLLSWTPRLVLFAWFGNTIVVTQKPSAYSSAFFFRFQISSNISRSIDIDLRFVFLIPNFIELIRQIDPWSIFSKNRLLTNEL